MNVRATLGFMLVLAGAASPAIASVHPGDQLYVTVYDHPELSGPVTVDTTERISLPLAGTVDVRGLETKQIASRVQTSLATFIQKPAVNVQMRTQQFSLFIAGGPGGTLKYEPGETLMAALGDLAPRVQEVPQKDGTLKAGDVSDLERSRLDLRRIGILRDGRSMGTFDALALSTGGQSGPTLQPGDTLSFVDKPNAVRVMGEVARPGYAALSENEPLADAISQVGGTLATASSAHIELRRDGTSQFLALGDPAFNAPAKNGDAVVIPAAPRVNIVGMVDKPGAVTLKTDTTLLSAMYEAGGPTKWADLTHVQVMQKGVKSSYNVTKLVHGDMSQNPQLLDGDVVFVPEGHKIAVGEIFQSLLNVVPFIR